ncbi:ATP-dependent DNA ligase [Ensifer sp. ENS04]|nr:non-homologous end-joining DNA ligase [Ensifer sp. ENS04]MBD9539975.1 ATP-dependent DNA ligase [Ensifer sp. ENS04]
MPLRIEPCAPIRVKEPPSGEQWVHEIKWDGWRLHVHIEPGRIRLLSKEGRDLTARFPAIVESAASFGDRAMILDGEAVVLDQTGRSVFNLVQKARSARAAQLMAFDLLYLDGRDLRPLPFSERRQLLENTIQRGHGAISLEPWLGADGPVLYRAACENELEGIVSKKLNAPYRSGETGDWLKVICPRRAKFAIIGFERSPALPSHLRSLLLAARRGGDLVYVGSVGTGFTNEESRTLPNLLGMIAAPRSLPLKMKGAVFTAPRYVATIQYRALEGGKLRHPSFKGISEMTDISDVYELVE